MKTYIAELYRPKTKENQSGHNGHFVARLIIDAPDRGRAAHRAQLWYWRKYRGAFGPAHRVLGVNDPYEEVRYGPHFYCGAKVNRLLPESVVERLLGEASGELVRDTRSWRPHHPPCAVRRVKRRSDFGRFIFPNIRQMRNGLLYYRVMLVAQRTKHGRRYRKRKCKDIRLTARSPFAALQEIEERDLLSLHRKGAKRIVRSRSLEVLRGKMERLDVHAEQAV